MSAARTETEAVNFGRPAITVRRSWYSFRFDIRTIIVSAIILLACAVIFVVALMVGDFPVSSAEVFQALLGGGEASTRMVVIEWRLPRALLALLFGAALALSGAIFQSLTRNPLGSPDIIGFASGSYTGALIALLIIGGGYTTVAIGALAGGIITAAAVYLLAYRRGVQGFRLIIVGIGVTAMLSSINTWLILKADLDDAMRAAIWGAGSLNGLGFDQLLPVTIACAILLPLSIAAGPTLRHLELGDEAAAALGVPLGRSRLGLILLGVALTALVTASAGPISFIALVAPQIACRLVGSTSIRLIPSALLGAFLLAAADLAAQRLFAPAQLPVGVMTVCLGGAYFVWLLVREAKRN